jgi:hypothetical protein
MIKKIALLIGLSIVFIAGIATAQGAEKEKAV